MFGTITFFISERSYGFITTPLGESYFFHTSRFEKDSQPVLEGQVEFDVAPPIKVGKKPMAVNVRYRKPAGGLSKEWKVRTLKDAVEDTTFISLGEAAKLAGCEPRRIFQLTSSGAFASEKHDGYMVIYRESFEKWLAAAKAEGGAA